MKKDRILDGWQKTTDRKDDMEGKIAVKEEVKIESHLKQNKEVLKMNDGEAKSKEWKRVASIPTIALSVWANEYNGDSNWFGLPPEVQKKILKEKLNSSEFRYFRTAEGKL